MRRTRDAHAVQLRLPIQALRNPCLLARVLEAPRTACTTCLFPSMTPSDNKSQHQDRHSQEESKDPNTCTDASGPA